MIVETSTRARLQHLIEELRRQLQLFEGELAQLAQAEESDTGFLKEPTPPLHEAGSAPAGPGAVSAFDLLGLSDIESEVFNRVNRQGQASKEEVVEALPLPARQTEEVLQDLVNRGILAELSRNGTVHYGLPALQRQSRDLPLDLWDLLESRLN